MYGGECRLPKLEGKTMKKIVYFVFLSINTFLALTLPFFAGIILTYADMFLPLGTKLVFPLFMVIVYISELILLIIGIRFFVHEKKNCFVFCTIICIVLFAALLFVPTTKLYSIINYKMNYDLRKEFVESLDNEIQNYPQIDTDVYFVKDIRLSYTGSVMIDGTDDGATKVMFDIGLGSSYVLIWSSDKSGVSDGDFSDDLPYEFPFKFKNIVKMDDFWSIAVIE